MSQRREFTAVIESAGRGGAFVPVPFDVEAAYGRKRPKILATIDGEPYRGLLVRMGGPSHMLLVRKEIREKVGKAVGDAVHVTVEPDTGPRVVTVPAELRAALDGDAAAAAFFDALSYTHRKEYVQWIEEAKREETRRRRIARTIEMLREGRRGR